MVSCPHTDGPDSCGGSLSLWGVVGRCRHTFPLYPFRVYRIPLATFSKIYTLFGKGYIWKSYQGEYSQFTVYLVPLVLHISSQYTLLGYIVCPFRPGIPFWGIRKGYIRFEKERYDHRGKNQISLYKFSCSLYSHCSKLQLNLQGETWFLPLW